MTRTGEGPVGVRTSGNSRRAALRRNLWALIKAKDIRTCDERGIYKPNETVREVCRVAVEAPSLLTEWQKKIVWSVWQELAEANKLHGIRTRNVTETANSTITSTPEKG